MAPVEHVQIFNVSARKSGTQSLSLSIAEHASRQAVSGSFCGSYALVSHVLCVPRGGGGISHVTEELSSLTFALHFCFVLNSAGRAHASVSRGSVWAWCAGGSEQTHVGPPLFGHSKTTVWYSTHQHGLLLVHLAELTAMGHSREPK